MSKSSRWPLLIDPESQANKWIRKMENKEDQLLIIKLADKDFLKKLERKITYGQPVLLENVGEDLDPSLEPLLLKQVVKNVLKLGDSEIEYSRDFKFYITTRLRNPHYLPELSTKVALINFMITQEGLADQLLVTVVAEEQPELAKKREQLILQFAENQKKLKNIQEKILLIMSTSSGNILDDDEAINVLSQSKIVSNQIELEQESAKITESKIEETRIQYSGFTDCIARLFFCITDLSNIDPMYQYSLDLFNNMYLKAIRDTEKSEELEIRLNVLEKTFTKLLYTNISRSLFEKDRLLFSFNLCLKFMDFRKELDAEELRFLITGGAALDEKYPNVPDTTWLTEKSWNEICRLSKLPTFQGFSSDFKERIDEWKMIFDAGSPAQCKFPGYWNSKVSEFQKLLILRCLRLDCLIGAITDFVASRMGKEFVTSSPLKLKEIYLDSNRCSPLIFILSPGSDPFRALKKLAESTNKVLHTQSLGQGQGAAAEMTISSALENGSWVLLMNCHLAESWMGTLEQIVQNIQPESKSAGKEFRLWLTSYPSTKFPVTLLQNGIKMTNEPPKGLKSNLAGSFTKDFITDPKVFNGCKREKEWKKLLYGLCFFNAVIQERRLYGSLGWNIPYEFSESDLRISVQQLRDYLDLSPKKIPFDALKYLAGECNFGGRVTDDKDRRLILTLLEDYYTEDLFKETYRFANLEDFISPPTGDHNSFMSHIESLPSLIPTEIYGFHPNAEITKNLNEAVSLFNSMLLTQSSQTSSKSHSSPEQIAMLIAENILNEPPEVLDEDFANKNFPPRYAESMNTVLTQEVIRFNNLTRCIRNTLADLIKAVGGQISMSGQIEATLKTLFDGRVPKVWKDVSYPSLKPLGGYMSDLKQRIEFFKSWLLKGQPEVFEISRFFFTQSFLTGSLQNYSRKMKVPIDLIKFNFEVTESSKRPEDGVIVKGLFLEGARWDYENGSLAESFPKVLFSNCPAVWLKPAQEVEEFPHYNCPVYKTSERRGELSTTGHSTNFVMFIRLNSNLPQQHWVKRGVALLTQLND
jgi:dynein heavy chain